MEGLVEPSELILVPCADTAPTALAAERVFGVEARYVCIDNQEGAYEAVMRGRADAISETRQQKFSAE